MTPWVGIDPLLKIVGHQDFSRVDRAKLGKTTVNNCFAKFCDRAEVAIGRSCAMPLALNFRAKDIGRHSYNLAVALSGVQTRGQCNN